MKLEAQRQRKNRKRHSYSFIVTLLWVLSTACFCHAQEVTKINSLNEAYALALKTHERIMIAEKEVVKSKLLPKKAATLMMPRISINGRYTTLDDPIDYQIEVEGSPIPLPHMSIETVPEDQWLGNFNFSQPIYEGEFFPLRRRAYQEIEDRTEGYYQITQVVLFQVAQAYYEVLKAEELVQNAKETLKLAQEELRVAKVKFEAGRVTEDTLLKSELNVTRAKSNIITNINRLNLAEDVFKRLAGLETKNFDLAKPIELKRERGTYDDLVRKAFENRHDYRIALLGVNKAESDIKLVKSRFHPKLEASWDYYRIDDPAYLQEKNYWAAALMLQIPLFEGGLRFLDLKEKRESLCQAKLALEDVENTIQIDVESAMLNMQTNKSILANLKKQLELAEKNYEIVSAKFSSGAATSLELNEALTSLDLARTQVITKAYDYQVSILNLEKAVGTFAIEYVLADKEF